MITNPTLKKDLLHAREPEQKKEGDRIHLHVRKESRPEDAASRPEGNRRTTIQDHADRQPLEKKAADSYTDLSDIDPYLGTERDLLVRSISVIERPATNGVDPSPAIIAPPSFESG